MALIPFINPNIDRIIDRDYEAYVDRLWDEAYGDHGERCKNCKYFNAAYKDSPSYCDREEATEEEIENDDFSAYAVDPEDCCDNWEFNESLSRDDDEPEDDDYGAE